MSAKAILSASVSAAPKVYVEDVFSTFLYTGNGSTQTITNGIDLAGEGGLVWTKARDTTIWNHIADTARGAAYTLYTNSTDASVGPNSNISAFNSNGFTAGSNVTNQNGNTFASWTFRKAPKFFDVVTYTGTGANRTIAHNLGSVPGCIIVKRTDTAGYPWYTYHRSLTNTQLLLLDSTSSVFSSQTGAWNSTTPTSTVFSLGTDAAVNGSGATYVAYVFAHDAGGFGDAGTDSVVKCGSYTYSASSQTVNLGWEPQFVLVKSVTTTGSWSIVDNMRGLGFDNTVRLRPNFGNAEQTTTPATLTLDPTGFTVNTNNSEFLDPGQTYIYIAIRRGPMKTPTDATKVFAANAYTGNSVDSTTIQTLTNGFAADTVWITDRNAGGQNRQSIDKLRGKSLAIYQSSTSAETDFGTDQSVSFDNTNLILKGRWTNFGYYNFSPYTYIAWNFRRAPGFFDVVAYPGTGSARTVAHNLGVTPELMLVKCRSVGAFWRWYWAPLGATKNLYMPNDEASVTQTEIWNDTAPTSSVFTVGTSTDTNFSARNYIAYLFASCPGVSKVGSYTGTGTTKQIDCGFTAGARFVLIKRTDSTGDWYVWDTARGITSGNDSYLLLNSAAAEVTSTDYIDPLSSGFEISSTAPAAINANGGSFIFFAVA